MKPYKPIFLALVMLLVAVPVAHAGSPQSKVDKNAAKICAKHTTWTEAVCIAVAKRQVLIGMNREMVRAAWGRPDKINTTYTAGHISEQWVFHQGIFDNKTWQYVYVDDGVVTAIQK